MNTLLLVETTSRASNSCHDHNHTSTIWDNFKKQKKKGSSLALEVLCKQLHYLSQRGSLKRSKTWPLARPLLPIWCSLFANYLRELTLYSCNNFRNAIEREREGEGRTCLNPFSTCLERQVMNGRQQQQQQQEEAEEEEEIQQQLQ